MRYEIEAGYVSSATAGQGVKFIGRKLFENLNENHINTDYWIFDDEIIFVMNYDMEGNYINGYEDKDKKYIRFYNQLSKNAVSLEAILLQIRNSKIQVNTNE